ncbi:MAG: cysteine desulfurase [Ruminococcaceae bacterium]|nr:cysteine desulfurase [Oscillospiraceae bacterium]
MNENRVYLDNSATTPLCEGARHAMTEAMECFGNPSSLHSAGYEAHKLLDGARKSVAASMGLRSYKNEQIVFTSCGSEASSLAIFGSVFAKERKVGNRILTTDCEHPAVEMAMRRLEAHGFEVVRIPTRGGALDLDALENALDKPIQLASFMMVNNETGARFEVEKAFALVKEKYPDATTHCDAVQGFLKESFNISQLGADMVSVSAHKIHGPKGVGALYVSPDVIKKRNLVPFLVGGGQESGLRSGTENMIGVCGFGAAAEEGIATLASDLEHMRTLRDAAAQKLSDMGLKINLPQGKRAPHILSVTLPNIKSETMLHFLSSVGVCVSSGSACSSHSKTQSSSLLAFGLTPAEADSTIRISFSRFNTAEDVDTLVAAVERGLMMLVRIKR